MAKTRTSYSRHPLLLQIIAVSLLVCALALLIASIILRKSDYEVSLFCFLCINTISIGLNLVYALTGWIEIDDEKKSLTISSDRKHPVDITKVDRIALHVTRKGHARYFTVHEVGKRYADFKVRRSSEKEVLEHLMKLNPHIEVVSYNA